MVLQRGNKLGLELTQAGLITEVQLKAALREQRKSGGRLGEALVNIGAVSPGNLIQHLARRLGVRGCHLRHGLIDPQVARLLPRAEAERLVVLPLFLVNGRLTVAMAEPQSLPTIDRLANLLKCEINPVLALESNIREFSAKYLSQEVNVESFLVSLQESDVEIVEREAVDDGPTDLDQMIEGSPIINLVNLAMLTAIRDGASDIHVEPDKKGTRVRYRLDGVLRDLMSPPPGMHAAIISRIKVIGKIDIAEKRLPQEGRVHIIAEGREIDLRVSTMPTILGEKAVLRVLDKSNLSVRLEDLGFRTESLGAVRRILARPHGIVLVTGPTGSGKTTTLYSALDLLRDGERNLVTVEDPVEYQLDLVNQIQVNESIGLTFSRALRSILRQDPDVIMVGEIRDADTATVAVQAALTGHLVLSTLHTNDAPGAITRLCDLGIEPFLISSVLSGVIAQRLARTICKSCRTRYFPPPELLARVGWVGPEYETLNLFRGEGCRQCQDSGHRGRTGIYEIMELDDTLRNLIHNRDDEARLRTHLAGKGWNDLRAEGLLLVKKGLTTLEEILRVTYSDDTPAAVQQGSNRTTDAASTDADQTQPPRPRPPVADKTPAQVPAG